jgi:hypothetical protein
MSSPWKPNLFDNNNKFMSFLYLLPRIPSKNSLPKLFFPCVSFGLEVEVEQMKTELRLIGTSDLRPQIVMSSYKSYFCKKICPFKCTYLKENFEEQNISNL